MEAGGDWSARAQTVLNANYLAEQLDYEVPFGLFRHEFVASANRDATDVAKRIPDYGVHPPTKWPEIVDEALTNPSGPRTATQSADSRPCSILRRREQGTEHTLAHRRPPHRPGERHPEPPPSWQTLDK